MAHFRSRLCLFTADSCSLSTSRALSSSARLLFFVRGQRTTPAQIKGFHSQHDNSEFNLSSVHPALATYCSHTALPLLPLLNATCLLLPTLTLPTGQQCFAMNTRGSQLHRIVWTQLPTSFFLMHRTIFQNSRSEKTEPGSSFRKRRGMVCPGEAVRVLRRFSLPYPGVCSGRHTADQTRSSPRPAGC